jgi:hypothetical protein
MNILYLYNSTQTYTANVFEHLSSFHKYSRHCSFFAHQDQCNKLSIDLCFFDAIVIHYTIRLPFDQIADQNVVALSRYKGLKALFIQDEYDHTHRVWDWIRRLGIQLVYTVVPQDGISRVYPPQECPGVRFVSVLTGYVPEDLPIGSYLPPSQRQLMAGYRGRPLPIHYGLLGREKISIGMLVARYCESRKITHDIEWTEEARIYGRKWYEFMSSCRSMLGSESGSNVFDWDGTLAIKIQEFRARNPQATDDDVYAALVEPLESPGLMNQVSPRIFEAIALRTVLVLFEGGYSGVVIPGVHFIPLKKDGSNLDEVFRLLADGAYVDSMAEQAYQAIIASERYSYRSFVRLVDEEIELSLRTLTQQKTHVSPSHCPVAYSGQPTPITTFPIRAVLPKPLYGYHGIRYFPRRFAIHLWWKLPEDVRIFLKPRLKRLLGKR